MLNQKMWDLFPPEIKESIISKIELKELAQISEINNNCYEFVQNRLRSYLCEELETVVASDNQQKMAKWKKNCYDQLPIGSPERKIIICAIFFFLGKYNLPVNFTVYGFQHIISEEYNDFRRIGYLFAKDIKWLKTVHESCRTTEKYRKILNKIPEVHHPLFGRITVHNSYFEKVFREQLHQVFGKLS